MAGHLKATAIVPEPRASIPDDSPSEHIYIGSDDHGASPASASTVSERVLLANALRRTRTDLTLYAEGILKVAEYRNGKPNDVFRLDLRYLDPVPTLERIVATRVLYAALGCAAAAGLAAFLARFEPVRAVAIPAAVVTAVAALVALAIGIYQSYERTEFCTIHGRAPVLKLVANLGSIKKFRAFVPVLSRAIEEATETIDDDTAAYLRSEMREHYRLRGDGVLNKEMCAESTGRILAQFDVQL